MNTIRFVSMVRGVQIPLSTDPFSLMNLPPWSSLENDRKKMACSESVQEKQVLKMALYECGWIINREWIEVRKTKDYALCALVEDLKRQLDSVTMERDKLVEQNNAMKATISSLQNELTVMQDEVDMCRVIGERTTEFITSMEDFIVHSSI